MKVLIDPTAAHHIYEIVSANRAKPKKTELELEINDEGKIKSVKEIS